MISEATRTNNASDEEILVKSAQQGNQAAFEKLVLTYERPLWYFIRSFLPDNFDVEDTVQQTIFKSFHALKNLRDVKRFKPWLFQIARNECLNCLRQKPLLSFSQLAKTKRQANEESSTPDFPPICADLWLDLAEIIERQELLAAVRKEVAKLEPKQRVIITLRYASELSFAEVAEILELKESTVKSILQRTKEQLRARLVSYVKA